MDLKLQIIKTMTHESWIKYSVRCFSVSKMEGSAPEKIGNNDDFKCAICQINYATDLVRKYLNNN